MHFLGVYLGEIALLYILARKLHLGFGRLFYKITRSHKWTSYFLAIVFLPGTFVHEFAHFLTALFLLVPVGEIKLIPEVEELGNGRVGVRLGEVGIGKTDPFRRFLIGIAPLVFGTAVIFLVVYFASSNIFIEWWKIGIAGYVVFEVGITMFSSRKDLEGAWKILLVFGVALLLAYLGELNIVFSQNFLEFLKKLDIFMAIPIIIDFVLILLFKIVKLI